MKNNITCAIIDDEQHAIDLLVSRLSKLFSDIRVTGTFTAWEKAVEALRANQYDLLLMDIAMPEKNGLELLELVPDISSEIIFVTAYDDFAIGTFAFNTSGYILKPVNDKALFTAVNKAVTRIKSKAATANTTMSRANEHLAIPNGKGIDYVTIANILYLEGINGYTKIVTHTGDYLSSLSLGKFEHLVQNNSFFQVHKSYIINLNSLHRYEAGIVILENKKEIPVSRNLRHILLEKIKEGF